MESEIKTYSKAFAEGFRFNNRNGVIGCNCRSRKLKNSNAVRIMLLDSKYVVDLILKRFLLGENGFRSKNADLKRLLIYRRHQVDFKWIKGTIITRRMNVVM
jgi:ribonuclease HI